jgi:DNA-binding NarL/FixJ family response regulator
MNGDVEMALIIAPPGRIRESWHVMLLATRRFTTVLHADDGPGGLEIVDRQPIAWVLLDGNLEQDAWHTLAQLRTHWPQTHCLLLTHSATQACQALKFKPVGMVPVDCSLRQLQAEMCRVQAPYEPGNSV